MTDNGLEDPRVRFAMERTLLAWVRTGLALMGFGFVVARFGLFLREIEAARHAAPIEMSSMGPSMWIGTALIVIGIVVNVAVSIEHIRLLRKIAPTPVPAVRGWLLGIGVAMVLAVLGVAMVGYLVLPGR